MVPTTIGRTETAYALNLTAARAWRHGGEVLEDGDRLEDRSDLLLAAASVRVAAQALRDHGGMKSGSIEHAARVTARPAPGHDDSKGGAS